MPENYVCHTCFSARLPARPGDPRLELIAFATGWIRTPAGFVCGTDCARSYATPFAINASGDPHRLPPASRVDPAPPQDERVACSAPACGGAILIAPGADRARTLEAHGYRAVYGGHWCSAACLATRRAAEPEALRPVTHLDDQSYQRRRNEILGRPAPIQSSHAPASPRRGPPPKSAA